MPISVHEQKVRWWHRAFNNLDVHRMRCAHLCADQPPDVTAITGCLTRHQITRISWSRHAGSKALPGRSGPLSTRNAPDSPARGQRSSISRSVSQDVLSSTACRTLKPIETRDGESKRRWKLAHNAGQHVDCEGVQDHLMGSERCSSNSTIST